MTTEQLKLVMTYLDGLLDIGWEKVNENRYRKRRSLNVVSIRGYMAMNESNDMGLSVQVIVDSLGFMDVKVYDFIDLIPFAETKDYSIFEDKNVEWYKQQQSKSNL